MVNHSARQEHPMLTAFGFICRCLSAAPTRLSSGCDMSTSAAHLLRRWAMLSELASMFPGLVTQHSTSLSAPHQDIGVSISKVTSMLFSSVLRYLKWFLVSEAFTAFAIANQHPYCDPCLTRAFKYFHPFGIMSSPPVGGIVSCNVSRPLLPCLR